MIWSNCKCTSAYLFTLYSIYRQNYNIRHAKCQNFNVSSLVLQLPLCNLLKPGVKSTMKMWLEQRRQAMLQLHLSDQQFYCTLRYDFYKTFEGSVPTKLTAYPINSKCYPEILMGFSSGFKIWDRVAASTLATLGWPRCWDVTYGRGICWPVKYTNTGSLHDNATSCQGIAFRITGCLWGEFGHQRTGGFPSQKASDGNLMVCLLLTWTSFWTNNRIADDLRRLIVHMTWHMNFPDQGPQVGWPHYLHRPPTACEN